MGLVARILDRLDVGDCWNWTGPPGNNGSGGVWYEGRSITPYRAVWEMLVGPVPQGLELDHLCRNRRCCNPDHLEPVTRSVNQRRGQSGKYYRGPTCKRGHEFTPENTYLSPQYPDRGPARVCRICTRTMKNERRRRTGRR